MITGRMPVQRTLKIWKAKLFDLFCRTGYGIRSMSDPAFLLRETVVGSEDEFRKTLSGSEKDFWATAINN
jgi:hypothetical protein